MIVLSDTSPLNYLVLIGQGEVLPQLFGEVIIPPAVLAELQHPRTPDVVRSFAVKPPAWLFHVAERIVQRAVNEDADRKLKQGP